MGEGLNTPWGSIDQDVTRSRDLLLLVLGQLGGQYESLTVIGAHAVMERTASLDDELATSSTRDGDLAVNPELLLDAPVLETSLSALGLEPALIERPGVWGFTSEANLDLRERLTIDLIAPDAMAGNGRRSADVGAHGPRSVTRAVGLELAMLDRSIMTVRTFSKNRDPVNAYVAGVPALLAAKIHKLHDRLAPETRRRRPERFRPKDALDVYRLMRVDDPTRVREVFDRHASHPQLGEAIRRARTLLPVHSVTIAHTVATWPEIREPEQEHAFVLDWIRTFRGEK